MKCMKMNDRQIFLFFKTHRIWINFVVQLQNKHDSITDLIEV